MSRRARRGPRFQESLVDRQMLYIVEMAVSRWTGSFGRRQLLGPSFFAKKRSCQELIHILIRQRDLEDQEAGVRFQSTYPTSTRRPVNFRTPGIYPETIESLVNSI